MKAIAFCNNDMALAAWTYDRHLPGCLGFAVYRVDVDAKTETAMPALARFAATPVDARLTTAQAPVQKFWWKDLGAKRGKTLRYRIVPMGGKPGELQPLDGVEPLLTNPVTLSPDRGLFKSYFNRGIVASQAVLQELGGKDDVKRLLQSVADPASKVRQTLSGELMTALTALLDRADAGGDIHAALYELNDPQGLEIRLQASDREKASMRTVILGNEREAVKDANGKTTSVPDKDSKNRQALKDAGVNVTDRILPKGAIPHNKFLILREKDQPIAVLTGSTNWTSTGLATQTNNALLIESPKVAAIYQKYWEQLKADADAANGGTGKWQGADLRSWTHQHNMDMAAAPLELEDGSATLEIHFSPNTKSTLKSPPTEKPVDMQRVFELIAGAKESVLFLAFDPGNNSVLDAAGKALKDNPDLFVRGALTSPERAQNFKSALKAGNAETGDGDDDPKTNVAVIGEAPHGHGNRAEPDYRAIPSGSITKNDAFGVWESEISKAGFAIIHDKIVVIDPFSANCTVILGSHNLGYRASHNNDENMVIVHGHRGLAEAYACHVLDIYDHYAWRYWLSLYPKQFGRPLDENDQWQERYIQNAEEKSAEMRFWLKAGAAA